MRNSNKKMKIILGALAGFVTMITVFIASVRKRNKKYSVFVDPETGNTYYSQPVRGSSKIERMIFGGPLRAPQKFKKEFLRSVDPETWDKIKAMLGGRDIRSVDPETWDKIKEMLEDRVNR